jgi:hypothetical protein
VCLSYPPANLRASECRNSYTDTNSLGEELAAKYKAPHYATSIATFEVCFSLSPHILHNDAQLILLSCQSEKPKSTTASTTNSIIQ